MILETLLDSAQAEVKLLRARVLECEKAAVNAYMHGYAEGNVDKGRELNSKAHEIAELESWKVTAKVERLIAHFTKRAKENAKRAEYDEFDYMENYRSSYYFSGKADSYQRAAEKVKEFLG